MLLVFVCADYLQLWRRVSIISTMMLRTQCRVSTPPGVNIHIHNDFFSSVIEKDEIF